MGDLTDGVVAGDNWFNTKNNEGSGPYVGWREIDPTITFATPVTLETVRVHVDDANGNGGVSTPAIGHRRRRRHQRGVSSR